MGVLVVSDEDRLTPAARWQDGVRNIAGMAL